MLHVSFGMFSKCVHYSDFFLKNYSNFYIRYSRMPHCSFPEERPASQPSYQPWTTSTNISPLPLSTTSILWRSRRPLQLVKKLSTVTMTKLTTPRCFGLQWVCIFLFFHCFFSYLRLVLHPRHKLHYFKNAGWQDEWIERAEEIVRTEFDLSYGSLDTSWATSRENQLAKSKVCGSKFSSYIKVLLFTIDCIDRV